MIYIKFVNYIDSLDIFPLAYESILGEKGGTWVVKLSRKE